MTFDTEEDKNIIIDLMGKATIPGSAVFIIANLIKRIQSAKIVPEEFEDTAKADIETNGAASEVSTPISNSKKK